MVSSLVSNTLRSLGIDVTDIGLASTPTVEMAVTGTGANGGIIITASHNPAEWNALKLLNEKGEFLSASDGNELGGNQVVAWIQRELVVPHDVARIDIRRERGECRGGEDRRDHC